MTKTHNDCETVYLTYWQALAMQECLPKLENNLNVKVTSIYVSEPTEGQGNWCDIMPTDAKSLLHLGMLMGIRLATNNK